MTAALTSSDPVLKDFAQLVGADGPVTIRGSGTRWELGGACSDDVRMVSAPGGIVDYIPAEMTVTVRAGTSVDELHDVLAASGQRTALPMRGGTVGGAVAVGENDLCQRGKGTVTSAVLQVRYVSAEGRLITGGGPTVKNVTGFDLPRLMCGSLGTLGFFGELILRTNPVPEVSRWFLADDVDPFTLNDLLLRPSVILWDGVRTWVLLEGHGVDVEAEMSRAQKVGRFAEVGGPPPLADHRWSLPAAELRVLGSSVIDEERALGGPFVASIGVGLVWAETKQPTRLLDPAAVAVGRRLKHNFDPTGRLNPGRSLGRP